MPATPRINRRPPSKASLPIIQTPPTSPPLNPPNNLANEISPYLLLSAHDPIHWYPWGQTAFSLARSQNKPILLSAGFLSCHMCDVMSQHFRDPSLAAVLNHKFICIKVDREERPDVDSVYNAFVQAVTGRSGWPLTCFLTPALVPFVGTTYLPLDRLTNAVQSISDKWHNKRRQVESDGVKVLGALRDLFVRNQASLPQSNVGVETLRRAFKTADTHFDVEHGGFGSAPKFPRPALFEFLLSLHLSVHQDHRLRSESLDMVLDSLREIAHGGIHDHVGGGFFRYSLDAAWHVPHFEKILSDQAQLSMSFLNAYLITRDESFRKVTCSTLDFVLSEMTHPTSGAFYSAIHADSESQYDSQNQALEGAFYTFSAFELKLVLGEPANSVFCKRFGVEREGNVCQEAVAKAEYGGLEGLNVFRVSASIADIAKQMSLSPAKVESILADSLKRVYEQRSRRPRPPTDDLTITCWTALTISAFARAGAALDIRRYIDAALAAADVIMQRMVTREDAGLDAIYLARAYREERGNVEAFAEDYADAIQAFIDCYEVTGDGKYLVFARRLQNALDAEFWEDGAYCNSKKGDANILLRRKDDYDGSEPSSSSVAALNLVRLSALLGDSTLWERAKQIANSFARVLNVSPLAMPMLLVAVQALATEGSKKVVVIGNNEEASNILHEYWSRGLPRSVALLRCPTNGDPDDLKRYLSARQEKLWTGSGQVSAYVCTGEVCLEPTGNLKRFGEELDFLISSHTGPENILKSSSGVQV